MEHDADPVVLDRPDRPEEADRGEGGEEAAVREVDESSLG